MNPQRRAGPTCTATRPRRSCRKLGVQRALGLPECATPPEEVYELAKRRGMDFVTITDHDTIAGVLEIADRPDVFVSEELTAWFRGEPQAVHVLCYGITPDDHEWLQAHADDVEACRRVPARARDRLRARAPVLRRRGAADAAPPPPPRAAVRRLGGRATARARRELNLPAASTSRRTAAPASAAPTTTPASTSAARSPRRRRAATPARVPRATCAPAAPTRAASRAAPPSGRTRRWRSPCARSAAASGAAAPDPRAVLRMVERVMTRGRRARAARSAADLGPEDARALLRAWLDAVDLDLRRRASCSRCCRPTTSATPTSTAAPAARHERKLRARGRAASWPPRPRGGDLGAAAAGALRRLRRRPSRTRRRPPSSAARRRKLAARDGEPLRVALVADGVGGDARRHPHDRRDPRARRARLRGRGDRHRRQRRPPPERGRRGRHPLLRRA